MLNRPEDSHQYHRCFVSSQKNTVRNAGAVPSIAECRTSVITVDNVRRYRRGRRAERRYVYTNANVPVTSCHEGSLRSHRKVSKSTHCTAIRLPW